MANLLLLIFGCSLIGAMETSLQIGMGTFIVATVIISEIREKK